MHPARRLVVSALISVVGAGTVLVPQAQAAPAGRYVVVLEDSVRNPQAVANEHARRHGAEVGHTYSHALKGYSATIPSNRLESIRSDPRVAYVEPDQAMSTTAQTIPWGISKVGATVSSTLAGNGSGTVSNVRVYVIDTGVYAHPDLNLVGHVNYAGGKNTDCNGHGTHVAGTIAAKDDSGYVVGVAPGAPVTGVKVLGCNGRGWTSNIIKGIDWVTANAVKPAIANMSLGGGASQALDAAVVGSAASGVFYALAAGNEGANACNSSPARAGAGTNNGIVTVGATDSVDKEASWSNYGTCVDIWAPGVSILSTRKSGGTTTMSGTSMASPHVGGGGALYLSSHISDSPSAVEAALKLAAQAPGTLSKAGVPILREYVGTL
jgi:subtilisin family serine protease